MKLRDLVRGVHCDLKNSGGVIEITGLCSHSDFVVPGNLFIAKRGGDQYIDKAIATGAAAVVTDIYNPFLSVPQIIHPSPEELEPVLAHRFYDNPSQKLQLVAVTGTNGKTTTSYIYRHIVNSLGGKCGLIGTVEYDTGDHQRPAPLTTPDVLTTHKLLSEMVRAGCTHCIIEASSHGLAQGRLAGLAIDVAIFTNISQDHLDYHSSMADYAEAKKRLFTLVSDKGVAIINGDDAYAEAMQVHPHSRLYSMRDVSDLTLSIEQSVFTFTDEQTHCRVVSPLVGKYNVYNALAALLAAKHTGFSLCDAAASIKRFAGVPGRMERIHNRRGLHVFVDFAHTEKALEAALSTCRELPVETITIVFGCGGNRDSDKRAKMARVVEKYADFAIITNDNPRHEKPEAIAEAIASGFSKKEAYTIVLDRRAAFRRALAQLRPHKDLLLVAGRGHEPFQDFGRYSEPFLDSDVLQEELAAMYIEV